MNNTEFISSSGNIAGFDGKSVERKTNYWSSAVKELLDYLQEQGFINSPKHLGFEENTEKLTFIDGVSGPPTWALTANEGGLVAFAKLLRSYHDIAKDFTPTNNNWAYGEQDLKPGQIICHNDFGPWNTVWKDGKPIAIIDWDLAGPGFPIDDIAYALQYVAPFADDGEAMKWRGYEQPPDRKHRINLFLKAYGYEGDVNIVDEVIRLQKLDIEHVEYIASKGVEPQKTWVNDGKTIPMLQKQFAWTTENRQLFE